MKITLKDLKEVVDHGIELYGEDTNLMICMHNEERFNTGWYATFDGIRIIEEASFKGEEAVSGEGYCFLEIKPIGY